MRKSESIYHAITTSIKSNVMYNCKLPVFYLLKHVALPYYTMGAYIIFANCIFFQEDKMGVVPTMIFMYVGQFQFSVVAID